MFVCITHVTILVLAPKMTKPIITVGLVVVVVQIRYIVLEDSVVEEVEGSVSAEGYLTISQLEVHSWNGLLLSNVTINEVGSGAFNLTHKVSTTILLL